MTSRLRYLVLITVLSAPSSPLMGSYIHSNISGSLNSSWSINFTIIADNSTGIIIHCFDSNRNQFKIEITKGNNNEKFLRVTYNRILKLNPIKMFQSCSECSETVMRFDIALTDGILNLKVNSVSLPSFVVANDAKGPKDENVANVLQPFPARMVSTSGLISISMGKLAPYTSESNTLVIPARDQLVGCVNTFLFNNRSILWEEKEGGQVRSSCPWRCRHNICNGGRCQERGYSSIACDCASTALNGVYCNRSLSAFSPGANNSYERVTNSTEASLKVTWRQLLYKRYCLVEIVHGDAHMQISIDKDDLLVDSTVVSRVDADRANFARVTFSRNRLTVTTQSRNYSAECVLSAAVRVNVGLAERDADCVTFEGAADVVVDPAQLRQVGPRPPRTPPGVDARTSARAVTTTAAATGRIEGLVFPLLMIVFTLCAAVTLMVLCVANLVLGLRKDTVRTVRNEYEEVIELAAATSDAVAKNVEGRPYSTIDYGHIYIARPDDGEDIDGYILPKPREPPDASPPLPVRQ